MHRIRATLATAAVTVAASGLLAAPAQAARDDALGANCDRLYRAYKDDGYFRAYDAVDCAEQLGAARGDDANWNDGSGPFRSPSNDRATSLLNTGTYAGGVNNVMVYSDAGPNGYMGCLKWGELYVDDLRDNTLFNANGLALSANNRISGHHWSSWCINALS